MMIPRPSRILWWLFHSLPLAFLAAWMAQAAPLELHTRARVRPPGDTNSWVPKEGGLAWESSRTALVVCDMWDKHHCPDATERVGEMVPRMNEVIKAARAKGVFIIHCPSDTMDFYQDHPGRKLAQAAPKLETKIPLQGWCSLNGGKEPPLPIDDSDGGCDGCPDCPSFKAWSRQHPGLEVKDGDAVTDSAEAFYLMRQRGITNVIVMGVHINMCVLGRPFSIRQMVTQGQNVVLMRDMTDSMYNHRKPPYVSHFRGTELVTEHIEQYWCPSITSVDFLGGEPFRFAAYRPKKIVCVIGENEYRTWETLPEFAHRELEWRGYKVDYVTASTNVDDNDFKNWETIPTADVLVISTRRRNPPKPMMDAIRAHIAAGKPVVGIRTASHAFELRDQKAPTPNSWMHFDEEVLGGDYQDHYGAGKSSVITLATGARGNEILNGVKSEFQVKSHLYKNRDLKSTVTPLLVGKTADGQSQTEPVAWINTADRRRVFYTSMGGPDDFADTNFRRLLLNGILWTLADFIPPGSAEPMDYAAEWRPMKVPGTWDENSQGRLGGFDGIAWYRCQFALPAGWPADSMLAVEQVDDAFEAYVDGVRAGASGTFPPNYTSGLGPEKRFQVKWSSAPVHTVAIRVFDNGGRGGFKGRAPEIRANGSAIKLEGEWQFRTGDGPDWAKPNGELKGSGVLPVKVGPPSASNTPGEPPPTAGSNPALAQSGPLTPAASAKSFHVAEDLVWEQVLAEPIVAQPVFLTFDDRSRLWVVEYRQYPAPAGLKMVSHDNFWRSVYDKVPPPPPHHFRGADRITIHEDTDGNGTFDKHTTFVDGLNIATSVAFGRGGVYILNPPYLLYYPDRNHDDIPDGNPEVLLSGFGLEDTHSVANSLRWGPDGWLYGCQGSTVTGNILVYATNGQPLNAKPIYSQGQNIWRYHPEKRLYEVFSEGGGNAFGLELDSAGRIFSGHNGGNTRGFYYMQGAYLQKGFDKHGPLSNPYAFGYFSPMPHNDVDRFTHNFIIYDSGELGAGYQGKLLGVEPLQGRIVMSEMTREGSAFRTRDVGYPVKSDDQWFRPVDIKLGPDGAIYVCDWYDKQVNHFRNHEGQMDASNGRIYRLRGKASTATLNSNREVPGGWLQHALSSSRWWQQTGLRTVADARDITQAANLRNALRQPRPDFYSQNDPRASEMEAAAQRALLNTLWALHACGGFTAEDATVGLRHWVPQVRVWTARLLGDEKRVTPELSRELANLAGTEPDVEVRTQLACTAKRLPSSEGLPIVRNLLMHDGDASDPRQPLLLWWAIEENCATNREAVLSLFADRELWRAPIVQGTILSRLTRRFAASGKREDLLVCARLFAMSPGSEQTAKLTQGFEEAYQGRPLVGLPEELLSAMEKAGGTSVLIGARRGQPAAVDEALATIAGSSTNTSRRLQLIQVFGETKQEKAVPVLLAVARDAKSPELRRAALGALGLYDSSDIGSEVLTQIPSYPPDVLASALGLLVSRPTWALALLTAVDGGRLDKGVVPNDSVRRIKSLVESTNGKQGNTVPPETRTQLNAMVTKLWPHIRQPTSVELEKEITRLTEVVNLDLGSPYSGKKLFLANCAVCHKLFGKGAEVGPDLTVFKRDDLGNLLLNIVNPNAEIREGYESYIVETRDGRTLNGFLADKDSQVIVLRTPTGQSVPIPRAEIATMEPAGASLMPEGLLANLNDQQIRDLFAYLRSTQPLNDGN